ncbi:hypothetical protein VTK56DRAFT_2814 [Thermocarpiscus australiensis]
MLTQIETEPRKEKERGKGTRASLSSSWVLFSSVGVHLFSASGLLRKQNGTHGMDSPESRRQGKATATAHLGVYPGCLLAFRLGFVSLFLLHLSDCRGSLLVVERGWHCSACFGNEGPSTYPTGSRNWEAAGRLAACVGRLLPADGSSDRKRSGTERKHLPGFLSVCPLGTANANATNRTTFRVCK